MTHQSYHSQPRTPTAAEELVAPLRPILPQTSKAKIMWGVLLVLTIWALAIASLGVPALVWPMKVIVPMAVIGLVALTWGM